MGTSGVTLADVHNHLEQGYFTKEDMDLLGLEGFVTIAQMRAEVSAMLVPKVVEIAPIDERAILRAEESQAAAQAEAKTAADRAALVKSIEDQAAAQKLITDFKNSVIASGGKVQ